MGTFHQLSLPVILPIAHIGMVSTIQWEQIIKHGGYTPMSLRGILPIKNYTRLISIVSKPIKVVVVVAVIVGFFCQKKS